MSEAQFKSVPQVNNFLNECIQFLKATWPTIPTITLGAQNTTSPMSLINYANAASVGSCNTACASAVITNVTGIGGPVGGTTVNPFQNLTQNDITAQFFSCGKNPSIVIAFPMRFPVGSLKCTIEAQGYSAFLSIKEAQVLPPILVSNSVEIIGSVIFNVPWSVSEGSNQKQTIYQNDLSISAAVWPVWSYSVGGPIEESLRNMINEAIQTALSEASNFIVEGLRNSVSKQLEQFFKKAIPAITSWVPVLSFQMTQNAPVNALCNSAQTFTIPPQGCAPCDFCCQCFVQQSCKGSCADCSCLKCGSLRPWILALFLFATLLIAGIFSREAILQYSHF